MRSWLSRSPLLLRRCASGVDTAVTFPWILAGSWAGHTQIITSLAVWVAVPLVGGLLRTARGGELGATTRAGRTDSPAHTWVSANRC